MRPLTRFPNPIHKQEIPPQTRKRIQIRVPERLETELLSLAEQQDIIEARQQAAEAARKATVPVLPRSSLQIRECPLDKVTRFDDRNPLKDAEGQ